MSEAIDIVKQIIMQTDKVEIRTCSIVLISVSQTQQKSQKQSKNDCTIFVGESSD